VKHIERVIFRLETLSRPSISPADEEEAWAQKKAVHAAEWAEWRKWNEENEAFAKSGRYRATKVMLIYPTLSLVRDPPALTTSEAPGLAPDPIPPSAPCLSPHTAPVALSVSSSAPPQQ